MGTNGKFFTLAFIKRTTGEERIMNATLNLASKLKGGDPAYDHKAKGLLVVTDVTKKAIRSIPLDAVLWVKAYGEQFKVVD